MSLLNKIKIEGGLIFRQCQVATNLGVDHGGRVENADGGGAGALADGEDGPLQLSEALVQLLSHFFGSKQQRIHLQCNEKGDCNKNKKCSSVMLSVMLNIYLFKAIHSYLKAIFTLTCTSCTS